MHLTVRLNEKRMGKRLEIKLNKIFLNFIPEKRLFVFFLAFKMESAEFVNQEEETESSIIVSKKRKHDQDDDEENESDNQNDDSKREDDANETISKKPKIKFQNLEDGDEAPELDEDALEGEEAVEEDEKENLEQSFDISSSDDDDENNKDDNNSDDSLDKLICSMKIITKIQVIQPTMMSQSWTLVFLMTLKN